MKVYMSINDLINLSEGKTFRCEYGLFKPSEQIRKICAAILDKAWLLKVYTPVLESNWQVTTVYLQEIKKRRRKAR